MREIQAAASSIICLVYITDDSGAAKTGLAYNTSGLRLSYKRDSGSAAVSVTVGASIVDITTLGTYQGTATAWGFKEVSSANMPGVYEVHVPNNAFASNAKEVVIEISGVASTAPCTRAFRIVPWNPDDSVRLGLTSLPNATVSTSGGLPTVGSQIPNANAAASGGLPTVDASNAVKLQSGTGANQLSLSSGEVTVATNNDKTGYALSAGGVQAIWDALTAALTTVNSIGKKLADFVLTAGKVTVGTNDDKTGYALTAGEHTAIIGEVQDGLDAQGLTTARAANLDSLKAFVMGVVDDVSATTTIFIGDASLSAVDDFYNGNVCAFTDGALKGQARRVLDYTGATKEFVLDGALTSAPADGVGFILLGRVQ
jgi:hypothetical protein